MRLDGYHKMHMAFEKSHSSNLQRFPYSYLQRIGLICVDYRQPVYVSCKYMWQGFKKVKLPVNSTTTTYLIPQSFFAFWDNSCGNLDSLFRLTLHSNSIKCIKYTCNVLPITRTTAHCIPQLLTQCSCYRQEGGMNLNKQIYRTPSPCLLQEATEHTSFKSVRSRFHAWVCICYSKQNLTEVYLCPFRIAKSRLWHRWEAAITQTWQLFCHTMQSTYRYNSVTYTFSFTKLPF